MNEMIFWALTLLILLGSSALFIWPVLHGKNTDEQASRDELNKAFFHDRMAEIKKEAVEGLVKDTQEIELELQQSLLDDIPHNANLTQATTKVNLLALLPGVLVLFVLSYGLYAKMGNMDKVKDWQQVANRLPELSALLEGNAPLTDEQMQDIKLALRTQLMKTPDEAMGWLLLGRLGFASQDISTSEAAMEKAFQLDSNNSDIQLGFAQSLMLSGEEAKAKQAKALLKNLIRVDSSNLQALSLLAFDAFESQDYANAVLYWSSMQKLLDQRDPRQEMLTRSIAKANAMINPETKSVKVTISLAENVPTNSNATLVVSVHDQNNTAIPVAAKLLPITSFPVEVELTDADSMIKERLLSSLPRVIVRARIDTDGDITTKAGDWGAQTAPIDLGSNGNIVIDQMLN